jgi:hypothetical protein
MYLKPFSPLTILLSNRDLFYIRFNGGGGLSECKNLKKQKSEVEAEVKSVY